MQFSALLSLFIFAILCILGSTMPAYKQDAEFTLMKRFRGEPIRFGKRSPREPIRFGKRFDVSPDYY